MTYGDLMLRVGSERFRGTSFREPKEPFVASRGSGNPFDRGDRSPGDALWRDCTSRHCVGSESGIKVN